MPLTNENDKKISSQRKLRLWPLVLVVQGSIPGAGQEKFSDQLCFSFASFACMTCFCTVWVPSDRDVNWRPTVHGHSMALQC